MDMQQEDSAASDASKFGDLVYGNINLNECTLDKNLPESKDYPENSLEYLKNTQSRTGLGKLSQLPVEVLHMILVDVDLAALTAFKHANRLAWKTVHSIPQYRAIETHAKSALRGTLAIESGPWVTCRMLYTAICTSNCENCGDFGGYLYLITCTRVCFHCFTMNKRYQPLRYSRLIRELGLDRQILKTLPQIRSVPGVYSLNLKKCSSRMVLVDYRSALLAAEELHGSAEGIKEFVSSLSSRKMEQYNLRRSYPSNSPQTNPGHPLTQPPFDGTIGNISRFVAVVKTPYFDSTSRKTELGFHCAACNEKYAPYRNRFFHFRRKFSAESFVEHVHLIHPELRKVVE